MQWAAYKAWKAVERSKTRTATRTAYFLFFAGFLRRKFKQAAQKKPYTDESGTMRGDWTDWSKKQDALWASRDKAEETLASKAYRDELCYRLTNIREQVKDAGSTSEDTYIGNRGKNASLKPG